MNLFEKFAQGLPYSEFLSRYGGDAHKARWQAIYDEVALSPDQRDLLARFTRRMNVLVLAGAWCGDCVRQCPIFQHFAAAAPVLKVRYIDRDIHAEAQNELSICGGKRVPVVVFFSEDGFEAGRFGDRTLSKYRQLMGNALGQPTTPETLLAQVTQDWLNEFERIQCLLRLSPRLCQAHGD